MTFFNELMKNVTEITETVTKKSSEVLGTQKLKMNKLALEGDIAEAYESLGRIYEKELENEKIIENAEVKELLEEIAAAKKAIAEIDDTLKKAKGLFHCAACGNDVARDSVFCPKCGAKLEKPEDKEEKEEKEEKIAPEDVIVEEDFVEEPEGCEAAEEVSEE